MPMGSLTPELWGQVCLHCLEEGHEGESVPQRALVNLLTVNKAFYDLAGRVLYRNPVITDIEQFFRGAYDPSLLPVSGRTRSAASRPSSDATKGANKGKSKGKDVSVARPKVASANTPYTANTKTALFQHVRHLTIIPDAADGGTPHRVTMRQRVSLSQGLPLLRQLQATGITVMPKLESVTVGSCRLPHNRESRIMQLQFKSDVASLINPLLAVCRPKVWCQYPVTRSSTLSLDQTESERRLTPDLHEIHTSLDVDVQVIWGTTNRVVVRREMDFCRCLWPWHKHPDTDHPGISTTHGQQTSNGTGHPSDTPDVQASTMDGDDVTTGSPVPTTSTASPAHSIFAINVDHSLPSVDFEDEEDVIDLLVTSIISSVPDWLRKADANTADEIALNTTFEFYGLEKLLPLPRWPDEAIDGMPTRYMFRVDRPRPPRGGPRLPKLVTCSLAGFMDSQFTSQYIEFKHKVQKATLQRLETLIRSELQTDMDRSWKQVGTQEPTIRLRLATEYPGCQACGQGKGDEWALDRFEFSLDMEGRVAFFSDDDDWMDDDDDDDMWPSDEGIDYDGPWDNDLDYDEVHGYGMGVYGFDYDDRYESEGLSGDDFY